MSRQASYDVCMKQANTKLDKMKQYLSVGMQTCAVVAGDVVDSYKGTVYIDLMHSWGYGFLICWIIVSASLENQGWKTNTKKKTRKARGLWHSWQRDNRSISVDITYEVTFCFINQ